jgi:hypothetical protein
MNVPRIGDLDELIDFLNVKKPYSIEGAGTEVSKYKRNVRASIDPVGGSQLSAETQNIQAYSQNYRVWIWYDSGVTPFMQIAWGAKRLTITAPPEQIASNWLLINCQETVSRSL